MLVLTVWLAIIATGGLCYPRRPRTAGVMFLVAACFMVVVWLAGAIGDNPPIIALASASLGLGQLWKFRSPAVRAAHVAEWVGTD